MSHHFQDQVSLAIAQRVAQGFSSHPEWIELAKSNLDRWSQLNQNAPALLVCYKEWRELLSSPFEEIAAALLAPTDEGQRLRQNSPFAGALTPAEVWQIKQKIHATTAA